MRFYKSKKTERIDYQSGIHTAGIISKIFIDTIDNEYNKLMSFVNKDNVLNACKAHIENEYKSENHDLNHAFFELKVNVTAYCKLILGHSEWDLPRKLPNCFKIADEIKKDMPSYDRIYEYIQTLKFDLAAMTNVKKVEIFQNCIQKYGEAKITEFEHKPCVIL